MTTAYLELRQAYINAAEQYRSKLDSLQNYHDELHAFVAARDKLQAHSDFSGFLPETYFSGGELDPVGARPGIDAVDAMLAAPYVY